MTRRRAATSTFTRGCVSLDATTEDERHWAFRAIATTNAVAAQNRIKKAWSATGLGMGYDRRQLFLMRNSPWPAGPKTAQLVDDFHRAGGRSVAVTDDDLRTMTALRDLIGEDPAELASWLRARRPAHGLTILREVLGDDGGTPPPAPVPEPQTEPESLPDNDEEVVEDIPGTALPRANSKPALRYPSTSPRYASTSRSSRARDRARRC